MIQKVAREARIDRSALFTAYNLIDNLRGITQYMKPEDIRYGKRYNGYSKQQIKDMARLARLELQRFSNELDEEYKWVDEREN